MNNSASGGWRWWLRVPSRLPPSPGGTPSRHARELAQRLAECHQTLGSSRKSRKKRTLVRNQIEQLRAQLDLAAPPGVAAELMYSVLVATEVARTPEYGQRRRDKLGLMETSGQCRSWLSTAPSVVLEQIVAASLTGWGAARNLASSCKRLGAAVWLGIEAGRAGGGGSAEYRRVVPSSPDHRPAECYEQGILALLGPEVTIRYNPNRTKWGLNRHEWRFELGRASVQLLGIVVFLLSSEKPIYLVEGSVDGQAWQTVAVEDQARKTLALGGAQAEHGSLELAGRTGRFRTLRVSVWALDDNLQEHLRIEFFGECWFEPHRYL